MSKEEDQWNNAEPGTNRGAATRDSCMAISPDGRQIQIPEELFLALRDFWKGARWPAQSRFTFGMGLSLAWRQ